MTMTKNQPVLHASSYLLSSDNAQVMDEYGGVGRCL